MTLSVDAERRAPEGLDHYLIVHGRAELVPGGAPELLQRLAHTYLGADVRFPPFENPAPGHVIRICADRVTGIGLWVNNG